uniref:Uncharacterized protein n=1 Tax=Avena sativa TaxID=4498 RepID=A0ACD5ZJE6_AVESA
MSPSSNSSPNCSDLKKPSVDLVLHHIPRMSESESEEARIPPHVQPGFVKGMSLREPAYDKVHRGYILAEGIKPLVPLRLRYHGHFQEMMLYDDRYMVHIRALGLLPFIHMVNRGSPHMNHAAITALVDRWRSETQNFHLCSGEMTVTLQDMSMILALPIQGDPLCINIASDNWRERMCALTSGKCPGDTINSNREKLRVTARATFKWITQNFSTCPENASADEIRLYMPVLYVALTVMDKKWSWGSAALAFLYRQLDKACRRTRAEAYIGGPLLLLSVWIWERFPIGRPKHMPSKPYSDGGERLKWPTWTYNWDVVSKPPTDLQNAYLRYTNEFDNLLPEQVRISGQTPFSIPFKCSYH